MSVMLSAYTRALKKYDHGLYAGLTKDGVPCVFRKSKRFDYLCEFDGVPLLGLVPDKQYVCGITHNWSASGRPRNWGIDDVVGHVREIDYLANKRLFEEMDEHNSSKEKQAKKRLRGNIEDFWRDERRRFAKATDDIMTHSLDKSEPRRRMADKRIKQD